MQISRHWRMNAKRYRLEGVRYDSGAVSLQGRPNAIGSNAESSADHSQVTTAEFEERRTVVGAA